MERPAPEESAKLAELQNKLQDIISEAEESNLEPAFYEGVKNILALRKWIIDLGIHQEEVRKRFEEFEKVCLAISMLEFQRMDVNNHSEKDLFTHIANVVNTVSEELEMSTTRKHYLAEAIEYIQDSAIVTDKNGTVLFANAAACKIINRSKEMTIDLIIANIFESQTQFGTKISLGESFTDKEVNILPYNATKIPVALTLKELVNPQTEETDGYLYIAREIGK